MVPQEENILDSTIRAIIAGPRAPVLTFSDISRSGSVCSPTFRIELGLKEALRTAADREHRSIANMVEVLIRDYCGRNEIAILAQDDLCNDSRKPAKGRK